MELELIVEAVEAAVQAAPLVENLITQTKNWIDSLASANLIPAATQDDLKAHVDAVAAAVNAGQTPPEFLVEPDPS